ncbi:substrate-binding domain-containing protein [Natronobacterium gregoryi]|uniref:ABC-type tungstate transport system, permease component n=2 Tax=Natronobacterium gregoryi TaxID=44930 RepID=L0AKK3_NATGS|nr:substrate-binding domain-containing protein [Natronobacterium gregoryi]AFZ74331.1 ABC-type tungstate transport system, permease component [Natronobacterium gregoryi SP2]ELY63427.1 tungstate ABC transporter permease [Natronobacterium gregoryi SP2]PLK22159.1 molybdenum transporter [Natronobacterium gregoryi SP2]SFI53883.1 tungstate transport system substrate-binding protein [Natronobacterium gregoryi]
MAIQRRRFVTAVGSGAVAGLAGCTALGRDDAGDANGPEISGETLTLTTTTSTYHTGLLDELNAPFQDRYGVTVDTVAQGTGAALETARNGDSDVVMVHARSLEDEFIEGGYGVNRRDLMFNDFVVVGATDDPASIAGSGETTSAFEGIAESGSTFVSRGDNSGTHTKELEVWEATGVADEFGEWYTEAGQGMGEVLVQADQQGAYTLADRGTYLSMQSELDLEILVEGPIEDGPEMLMNPYGIVAVNPAVHDTVNYDLAMAYIGYVTSLEAEKIIRNYTSEGEQLFFPEAISEEPNFEQYVPEEWERNE